MPRAHDAVPSITLVDDSADDREMYAHALGIAGYRTVEAADPLTAFQRILQDPPDLIVADIMMPGPLDGIEFTRKLSYNTNTRHIPIVVLTAMDLDETRSEAARAGAAAFLTKPCSPTVLLDTVNRLLAEGSGSG